MPIASELVKHEPPNTQSNKRSRLPTPPGTVVGTPDEQGLDGGSISADSLEPSSKRARIETIDALANLVDASHTTPEAVEAVEVAVDAQMTAAAADAAATFDEGFRPGTLIALELCNFQVSKKITYRFCPTMNLILGANGTGKSTIITAIFVLFLGDVASMDRRDGDYGSFIKSGCREARIRAVIQAESGTGANAVLEMVIRRPHRHQATPSSGQSADDSTDDSDDGGGGRHRQPKVVPQWFLNGLEMSRDQVRKFVHRNSIQVNNLCQFLPQTRVAEFSGETMSQRLRSTEYAVGYEGMARDHDQLVDAGRHLSRLTKSTEDLNTQIAHEEAKRESYASTLAQLELSQRRREELLYLNQLVPLVEYSQSLHTVETLTEKLQEKRNELESLETVHAPTFELLRDSRQALVAAENSVTRIEADYITARQSVKYVLQVSAAAAEKVTTTVNDLENFRHRESQLQRKFREAAERRAKAKEDVRKYQANRPSDEAIAEARAILNASTEAVLQRRPEFQRLEDEVDGLERDLATQESKRQRRHRQLAELQRGEGRRDIHQLPMLFFTRQMGQHLFDAVRFVQQLIRDRKFLRTVHMPAVVSASITNPHALHQIDAVTRIVDLQKFVCECKEDFELLTRLAAQDPNLVVRAVDVSSVNAEPQRGAISRADIESLGFDGFILDLFEAPEPVMKLLQVSGNLGRVPYALRELPSTTRAGLEALGFTGDFVDSQQRTQLRRSRYGRHDLFAITSELVLSRDLKWAKYMSKQDTQPLQDRLQQEIDTLGSQITHQSTLLAERREAKVVAGHGLQRLQQDESNARRAVHNCEQALVLAMMSKDEYDQAGKLRKAAEQELQELRLSAETLGERLRDHMRTAVRQTSLKPSVDAAVKAERSLVAARLEVVTQRSVVKRVEVVVAAARLEGERAIEELEAQLNRAKRDIRDLKNAATLAKRELAAMNRLDEAQLEAVNAKTDDVRNRISRLKAEISLNESGESYATTRELLTITEAKLEDLRSRHERDNSAATRYMALVEDVGYGKWVPQLEQVVSRVSDHYSTMFRELGCRGEVRLIKDGTDFDKWGLEIVVSFRDVEPLQPLSRQRQSGGERAVATAVYLLSLQDMARAPFRVLDEINQGMDEFNERKTHEFIVKRSTEMNSQLFLVTPKLLLDLPYEPLQRVQVIFSSSTVSPALPPQDHRSQAIIDRLVEEEEENLESDSENGYGSPSKA